jgi:hypothetical protein
MATLTGKETPTVVSGTEETTATASTPTGTGGIVALAAVTVEAMDTSVRDDDSTAIRSIGSQVRVDSGVTRLSASGTACSRGEQQPMTRVVDEGAASPARSFGWRGVTADATDDDLEHRQAGHRHLGRDMRAVAAPIQTDVGSS